MALLHRKSRLQTTCARLAIQNAKAPRINKIASVIHTRGRRGRWWSFASRRGRRWRWRETLDQLLGESDVGARREFQKRAPLGVFQRQRRDELLDQLAIDGAAAGQLLERLVRMRQRVTAHHSLDRLCQDLPSAVGVEIGRDAPRVQLDAIESTPDRDQRYDHMAEGGA